ncbi:hypothetical protein PybrP1_012416, partial [[Pythium] brassicae (nom. inval.)]
MSEKWFVVGKRKAGHAVVIAPCTRHPALFADSLFALTEAFNWISGTLPKELIKTGSLRCRYRVRYRQELGDCTLSLVSAWEVRDNASALTDWEVPTASKADGGNDSDSNCHTAASASQTFLRADFDQPQRGVTPQQALVLYRSDGLCYGGGPIAVAGKSYFEQGKALVVD